jgi:5'(3')-deoxyribonucleotidase
MQKPNLFIDFDDTSVMSSKAFCDTYNSMFKFFHTFKPADYKINTSWDFIDVCPLLKENNITTAQIFGMHQFYEHLDFFPNAKLVIRALSEKYNLCLVTIGTDDNIYHKVKFVKERMPFIKNKIYIVNGEVMDKSIVKMTEDDVFIDDHQDNLNSTMAGHKIIFGDIKPWNKDFQGVRASNWLDVMKILNKI